VNIDKDTLVKIAHLARLELDEKNTDEMLNDLSKMLDFVGKLNEVSTDGVEPLTTMSHEVNALREDNVSAPLDHQKALQSAPKKDDDFFRVPKVLE